MSWQLSVSPAIYAAAIQWNYSVKLIIAQPKERIAEFVSKMTNGQHFPWENFSALALVDDMGIIAGVLYNYYTGTNICMHVAAVPGRKWLTRQFLFAAFDYPFNQLKVRRVTGLVPAKNEEAIRFDTHLGFELEGRMSHALADDDMLIFGLLRENCKWHRVDSAKRCALAA
jgi:RimJ/RimL family protein N-acetyltransferase